MAKRKLGASAIILCIAAITLISGTYAWFLVGGTAKLFDLGFGVIESGEALELRGDDSASEWKTSLTREDFTKFSFITDKKSSTSGKAGHYKPVSTKDGLSFVSVGLQDHDFVSYANPIGKATATDGVTDPNDVCYNDFTFYVRAVGEEEIVNSGEHGAYMQIQLGACKVDDNGEIIVEPNVEPDLDDDGKFKDDGAAHAARVAVTISGVNDDKPVIYDVDGENYYAVTSTFSDGAIQDADPYNQIIDGSDSGNGSAGLTQVEVVKLTKKNAANEDEAIKIFLGNIPGSKSSNHSTGTKVRVQIWLEGNDKDCVDIAGKSIAGKNLFSKITFGIAE